MKRDKRQKSQNTDSDGTARKIGELQLLIQEGLGSGPSSPLDMNEVKRRNAGRL